MIPIYVGYDPRESVAYHTFCNSVIRHATTPVQFIPLAKHLLRFDGRRDGSNDFIYSRFLVPYLNNFKGWAIYADGDMICKADIYELMKYADKDKAVIVAQHDYKTKAAKKYLGNKNEDYPRKNWSSVILWNCGHESNSPLTLNFINMHNGAFLHRFKWLQDNEIGSLPLELNWLVDEYPHNENAKLLHYTLGTPCFDDYWNCDHAAEWHNERFLMNEPNERR